MQYLYSADCFSVKEETNFINEVFVVKKNGSKKVAWLETNYNENKNVSFAYFHCQVWGTV